MKHRHPSLLHGLHEEAIIWSQDESKGSEPTVTSSCVILGSYINPLDTGFLSYKMVTTEGYGKEQRKKL
jgi:hypothetical protein